MSMNKNNNMNNSQLSDDNIDKCKEVFKLLNCNLLWIMHSNNDSLEILSTDQSILKHYINEKYYLYDPINLKHNNKDKSAWKVTLGTDCDTFNKSGFLYDLYKMFNVEEFVSIEKKTGSELYCYRFFTKNNRFIFINKLLNHMPIIKHFITTMIEKTKAELNKQSVINMAS